MDMHLIKQKSTIAVSFFFFVCEIFLNTPLIYYLLVWEWAIYIFLYH